MDIPTLAAVLGIVKQLPDTAAARAEAAAEAAEGSAELAQEYGYRITVEGSTLVVGQEDENAES